MARAAALSAQPRPAPSHAPRTPQERELADRAKRGDTGPADPPDVQEWFVRARAASRLRAKAEATSAYEKCIAELDEMLRALDVRRASDVPPLLHELNLAVRPRRRRRRAAHARGARPEGSWAE